jgi:threonine synthase
VTSNWVCRVDSAIKTSHPSNHLPQCSDRHHLSVVGATSGDTGSAAIYGLRGKKDVSVFILHPKGRVSPIQEAQMTTVLDPNVHNLSVTGTFDDCQVSSIQHISP